MDAVTLAAARSAAKKNGINPGYDIIILAGQSNMSGRGTPYSAATDPAHPRIFQYKSKTPNANTIVAATEPLDMHDTPSGIGPGLQFARWYAARALQYGRKILLVPVAHGGTALSTTATPLGWRRGVAGNLYANMVTQTQGALAAAGAGSRIVAALWVQGETDGDNGTSSVQYQTDLDALINGLRTDLGISDLPFLIGTMVPEYLSSGTRSGINAVHRDTPNRLARVDVAVGAANANLGDGNHYSAAGQRTNGRTFYDTYERINNGLAAYSEVWTPPSPALGVTSAYPLGAYSLRRVVSGYTGSAVLVRRSSDSTTQAIGFDGSGNLDTTALLAFTGTGDGFVATWFDQSGNGKHVTQATAANQPKIVAAGAVLTANSKPIVRFDGSASILAVASSLGLYAAGAATAAQVVSAAQPVGQKRAWSESISTNTSPQYGLLQPDGSSSALYPLAFPVVSTQISSSTVTPAPTKTAWNSVLHQMSAIDTGSAMSQWIDAAADLTAYAYTRAAGWTVNTFAIGGVSRGGTAANFGMDMAELILWPTAFSTADRQTVEASQKAYYGTP